MCGAAAAALPGVILSRPVFGSIFSFHSGMWSGRGVWQGEGGVRPASADQMVGPVRGGGVEQKCQLLQVSLLDR